MNQALKIALLVISAIVVGVPLYAIPATLTLPPGPRPGIKKLTISQAAEQLRATGKTGRELIEAARALVAERMQYCRRNSFDPAPKAFERGYGYCQQQAYALVGLLAELGIESKVVQSFKNQFPDGSVDGHAWVSASLDAETRNIDSLFYDTQTGNIDFTPLTKIYNSTHLTRVFFGWGITLANAHRYYVTGKDQ